MNTTTISDKNRAALDPEACWQAVRERDAQADGRFVYAVRSTHIYCRPSCPARLPGREQVLFFPAPEAAEQAGFRPCLRCRPREAVALAEKVQHVCRYIEAHLDEPLDLETLGAQAGLSPAYLQRTFKRQVGVTPRAYADTLRMDRFKACVKEGQDVTSALYEAGYGSSSRLYARADAQLGMTPATYRQGGKGQHIAYTIADCTLGRLLVAATAKGVCAIRLGDEDAVMEAELHREFPAAEIHQDAAELREWVESLVRHLNGTQPCLDLPLDVQATAFQRRVWTLLQAIPYGSTRSYGQIAQELGQPNAVRAVARACAANPVALAVPCHRVVREDGSLAGYRWGLPRKQALLDRERRVASPGAPPKTEMPAKREAG